MGEAPHYAVVMLMPQTSAALFLICYEGMSFLAYYF